MAQALSSITPTLKERVAVGLVSQPKDLPSCAHCRGPLEGLLALHLCPACKAPQPLLPGETYFRVLGAPVNFILDTSALEKNFYLVSRALHPDRFTQAAPELKILSNSRMSFLNQAYSTLKDEHLRRIYLLKQTGYLADDEKTNPTTLPALGETIEAWFEIQDLLTENSAAAQTQLQIFETQLAHTRESLLAQIHIYEKSSSISKDVLAEIASRVRSLNYLDSLQRDVERIKTHAHTN